MSTCAQKLISELSARGCDFTLLFWLRNPEALADTELGKDLGEVLHEVCGLSLHDFHVSHGNREWLRDFFGEVRVKFREVGIVPVNPRHFLIGMNQGGKADVLARYKQCVWPRPRQPYCMQTMGVGVLFVVFQTWQDGLIFQRNVLRDGGYTHKGKFVRVEQVYEHNWNDGVVRLMIDWEIMLSAYEDRKSEEEIRKVPDKFPEWLVGRLRETRAIGSDVQVECVVKDKTRKKGSDLKLSKHFVFNISGVTKGMHYEAMSMCIKPWVAQIREFHKDKVLSGIRDEDLLHPVWGWDNRLLRGQNGIGTLFGRKQVYYTLFIILFIGDVCGEQGEVDAPYPTVSCRLMLSPGRVEVQKFSWSDSMVSVHEEDNSLKALYHCSYTPPHAKMIAYDMRFIEKNKVYIITMTTAFES